MNRKPPTVPRAQTSSERPPLASLPDDVLPTITAFGASFHDPGVRRLNRSTWRARGVPTRGLIPPSPLITRPGVRDKVVAVAFESGDAGLQLVAAYPDGSTVVSELVDGGPRAVRRPPPVSVPTRREVFDGVVCGEVAALSPQGRVCASAYGSNICVVSPHWERGIRVVGNVSALALSGDGSRLVAGVRGNHAFAPGHLEVFDAVSAQRVSGTVLGWNVCYPVAIGVSSDGRRALVAARAREGYVVQVRDLGRAVVSERWLAEMPASVAVSPCGQRAVFADQLGRVMPVYGGDALQGAHPRPARALAFSPGSDLLASGSLDGVVIVRSVGGPILRTFTWPGFSVRCLAFSPDARYLGAGSADGSVRICALH